MSPVQNLINEIDKALAITPDLFVDFIVNVNSLNANGENIHRQVRGCDVIDLFLDRDYPNSSLIICLSSHDHVFDFHKRYLVMHHALSTFLDNPPAQPQPLTDKLSTFSASLKDMIKHVEEKDCRELNDLTISGSFDVFLNDCELDDLCLRIFTKHYIDIVVDHDRKTLTEVF
ncbi:hypothetical protein I3271_09290 [Photobacterium leiognathi]|uniref:hypothetical protein n=1 Tax=Photobacterium leiognathi TaxID=553611 RepID=UPI001EDDE42E|nr:hypothetical protein [Photobacterium leiognathi]MCG3884882.1 hypothetical protein [Photobacterium leiognathi]